MPNEYGDEVNYSGGILMIVGTIAIIALVAMRCAGYLDAHTPCRTVTAGNTYNTQTPEVSK